MSRSFPVLVGFALLVTGLMCGVYWQYPVSAQDKKEEPKTTVVGPGVARWEYRIVVMEEGNKLTDQAATEKELNRLGEQGFEIAFQSSSIRNSTNLNGNAGPGHPVVHYTLRRIKQ